MINKAIYDEICTDFFPVAKKLSATDIYSITLGGSHGKGISDQGSDFDFRIYYEASVEETERELLLKEIKQLSAKWRAKNIEVDGVWPRTYAYVDEQLDLWFSGNGKLIPLAWSVWGYSILTDIYNQIIIEDPSGKAAQWKKRLSVYPEALKTSIISLHGSSLKYWRNDYHYRNKVNRKDIVFLASITVRLINDIIQVIYALNEFYYPGDGMNLLYTKNFHIKPADFEERIKAILYITDSDESHILQYKRIIELIDDTLALIKNE